MKTQPERSNVAPHVRRPAGDLEPVVAERVIELQADSERVAGLRMQGRREHRPLGGALLDPPLEPADEAVNRIRPFRLVERCLAGRLLETVRPVLQPVRPRSEHLPPAAGGHFALGELPDDRLAAGPKRPQARADLGHRDSEGAVNQFDLVT